MIDDEQAKENIAANVSRLLDEKKMTRYRLAQLTGENQTNLYHVVHGQNVPRAGALARIAEALGVTIDFLVNNPAKKSSRKKLEEVA